jgi:hypothetical protein
MPKLQSSTFLGNHPVRVTITVALLAFVTITWVTHWINRHGAGPPCTALAGLGAREENGRCVIDGLNTANYRGQRLPDNLTVRGDLQIYGQRLDILPKGLIVVGELFFYKATYAIPEDLVVRGNVDSYLGLGDELLKCAEIPKTAKLMGSVRCE